MCAQCASNSLALPTYADFIVSHSALLFADAAAAVSFCNNCQLIYHSLYNNFLALLHLCSPSLHKNKYGLGSLLIPVSNTQFA